MNLFATLPEVSGVIPINKQRTPNQNHEPSVITSYFSPAALIRICAILLQCVVARAQVVGDNPSAIPTIEKHVEIKQQVTVTATRSTVGIAETGKTVDELTTEELVNYPALTMDERLEQHAGFQLYRRSAGRVQNPTSQGISLRGLGSTAASRTLVLEDGAPLNDPFGGWVHWDEMPVDTVDGATIATGGGSDLYGSSALGGVIDLGAAEPKPPLLFMGTLAAAGQDTRTGTVRIDAGRGPWGGIFATELFRTSGYVLVAPEARGQVDTPANVHYENGRVQGERQIATGKKVFVTGNLLNEARGNGTPLTTNGTRLWRYLIGDDWLAGERASGRIRVFGSDEAYRQTFSSVLSPAGAAARSVENLTRLQGVHTQELGASLDVSVHLGHAAFVAGTDARDIRGTDVERPVAAGAVTGLVDTSARQRFVGAFGELLGQWGKWSGAASVRVDHAANLDTEVLSEGSQGNGSSGLADRGELVSSPRLGVVRQIGDGVAAHASLFRAFRSPTMNELYRTGQVGSETTEANPLLSSERATGWEVGSSFEKKMMDLSASYFWTEINRPVSALLISQTPTSILDKRENLGQIRSDGVEVNLELNERGSVSATVGYQFADAVVTKFPAQTSLVGKWIPEVPRNSATAQVRARKTRLGQLIVSARESGRVFDDSANTYLLHGAFVLDAFAERCIGGGFTAFVSGQNLLGRRVEVARTPVLTLGSPVMVEGGLRFQWGGITHNTN